MNDFAQEPLTEALLRSTLGEVVGLVAADEGPFHYCLIGTAAAALRGVPLVPGDIDLLVRERAHVETFARALGGHPCVQPPTWLPDARQYFAAFSIGGARIEASTVEWPTEVGFLEAIGSGPWTYFTQISIGAARIPTIAIELRLATELRRRRSDRIGAIAGWMRSNPYDPELLEKAMTAQNIDPDIQRATLSSLLRPERA